MPTFEYDENKSQSNLSKHGIDFLAAQALWNDPKTLVIPTKAEDETRFLIVGKIGAKHWTAVITYRGQNTRIISVRRSRQEEVTFYES
jgi:uncharacterized protein